MLVNLNVHSYYTISGSLLSIKDIVSFSLKNNMTGAALTDIDNMFAAREFFNECQKANIKPFLGLEANFLQSTYVFIAKNNAGYLELANLSHYLISHEVREANFSFLKNENVFAIHKAGPELPFINNCYTFDQSKPNRIAIHTAKILSKKDNHLLHALPLIQVSTSQTNPNLDEDESIDYELWNEDRLRYVFDRVALSHLEKVVNGCSVDLAKIKAPKLQFPFVEQNHTAQEMLERLCLTNLKSKGIDFSKQKNYRERLNYEISVLKQFGFVDYFLIVWDLVNYAHKNDILIGPGRGSAAGSLVAYALKITAIDPIKYGLIFERFLNPERISMPDIDLDIADHQREQVLAYLSDRYGKDHFALISTFQKAQAKRAIRDAGVICKTRPATIDAINKSLEIGEKLPSESARQKFELNQYMQKNALLFSYADRLFDLPRQVSTHAAGVVILQEPLKNFVPLFTNNNGYLQVQFSYQFLEQCGLVKIDLLGLKNLSIIQDIVKQIFPATSSSYDRLLEIPLNDPLTMTKISEGLTFGIFQLESAGMTNLIKEIKPKTIDELAHAISLYRPGPMNSRHDFVNNARDPTRMHYIDESLKDILQATNGIIIYQEQIIRIVKKVANFSNAQADLFRRAISKKEIQTMQKLKTEFIECAVKNQYSSATAEKIYRYIETFADYGFNRSHAVSYALISYWMAYLKFHHPLAFFVSWFNHNSLDELKFGHGNNLARELNLLQIRFRLPSLNDSTNQLAVGEHQTIQLGFNSIRGFNSLLIDKLSEARAQLPLQKITDLAHAILFLIQTKLDRNSVKQLIGAGALREFEINSNFCFDIYEIFSRKVVNLANIDQVIKSEKRKLHAPRPSLEKINDIIPVDKKFFTATDQKFIDSN